VSVPHKKNDAYEFSRKFGNSTVLLLKVGTPLLFPTSFERSTSFGEGGVFLSTNSSNLRISAEERSSRGDRVDARHNKSKENEDPNLQFGV
jgi:hypothetical protein